MRPIRLKARARIGQRIGIVEPQAVERACARIRREAGKISVPFVRELDLCALELDTNARGVRGPDAKMDTGARDFRTDGQTSAKCARHAFGEARGRPTA